MFLLLQYYSFLKTSGDFSCPHCVTHHLARYARLQADRRNEIATKALIAQLLFSKNISLLSLGKLSPGYSSSSSPRRWVYWRLQRTAVGLGQSRRPRPQRPVQCRARRAPRARSAPRGSGPRRTCAGRGERSSGASAVQGHRSFSATQESSKSRRALLRGKDATGWIRLRLCGDAQLELDIAMESCIQLQPGSFSVI